MKISPVKFDDLAFILLFFFMIVAVISFSNSMKIETAADSDTENKQAISVFLDENGNLSQDSFAEGDIVDLTCSPSAAWQTVRNAVTQISEQKAVVTLVI